MINYDYILQDFPFVKAAWAKQIDDDMDLARIADSALQNKIADLSVQPEYVSKLWAWLENKKVKIIARFYAENIKKKNGNFYHSST